MTIRQLISAAICCIAFSASSASAQVYNIDPGHTYPSFEADHMGLSIWRGKFTKSSGKIVLDRQSKSGGSVEISIDASSIDFGHAKMNEKARGDEMFNIAKYPVVTFKSTVLKYDGDKLAAVDGEMTMLGITKPLSLTINQFKCLMHPLHKREVCGADAHGRFDRSDFGMNIGLPRFSPEIKLAIQVEGIRAD
ncbi:MAG: YceI family protein [Betaproteobacteria bacterium]